MFTGLEKLLARRDQRRVSPRRRLAVEALESRTVLSAAPLAASALLGDPLPADALCGPFPVDHVTAWVQADTPWLPGRGGAMSDMLDGRSLGTPTADVVSSDHFASELPDPRFFDSGDATRSGSVDQAIVAWESPSRPRLERADSFDVFAVAWSSLEIGIWPPSNRVFALPGEGEGLPMFPTMTLRLGSRDPFVGHVFGNDPAASNLTAPRAESPAAAWGIDWAVYSAVLISETGPDLVVDVRVVSDAQAPPRVPPAMEGFAREEPAARLVQGRAGPESNAVRPGSPPLGSFASPLDDLLPAPSMASQESRSPDDGGLVVLAALGESSATAWDLDQRLLMGRLSTAENDLAPTARIGHEYGPIVRNGSRQPETSDLDVVTELADPFGSMPSPGLAGESEGGVVELGEFASPMRTSLSPHPGLRGAPATIDLIWDDEQLGARERSRLRPSLRDELLDETRLHDAEDAPTTADRTGQSQGPAHAAEGSHGAREHEEGGTIELAVAAYSTSYWLQAEVSPAEGRAQGIDTLRDVGGGSIPMDTGVGLFQAFELATGPAERVVQPRAVLFQGNEPGASPATKVDATAEQAALGNELTKLFPNRALAVPSVLIVLSLCNHAARRDADKNPLGNGYAEPVVTNKKTRPQNQRR